MKEMINKPIRYKYLIFLAMFSMIIMPSSIITTNKIMLVGGEYASAGSLILPLWFVISDIIAEVYGFEISKKIFWYTLICQFFFVAFTYSLAHLPSPTFWHSQQAYNLVTGNIIHLYFGGLFAIIAAGYVNIYFITKWKKLVEGRIFWLRSIGSSTIGEAFYTALAFLLMFIGTSFMTKVTMFILWAYLFKVIYAIIFALPANIIVNLLKKAEGIDIYDHNKDLDPFN